MGRQHLSSSSRRRSRLRRQSPRPRRSRSAKRSAPPAIACSRWRDAASSPIDDTRMRLSHGRHVDAVPAFSADRALRVSRARRMARVRIISPDVGGGFGYKGLLCREEVALGWLATAGEPSGSLAGGLPRASRRAMPTAASITTTSPDMPHADGKLLAIDCVGYVDAGAYSAYPISSAPEAAQIANLLPGPYVFSHLPLPLRRRGHEQVPDHPVSRRGAHGHLPGDRSDHGCDRPRERASSRTRSAAQHGAAGADAVRQCGGQAFRQRRSSGMSAPRRRGDSPLGDPRTPEASAEARRTVDRRRPVLLRRAGRARDVGACRPGVVRSFPATSRPTSGSPRMATSRSASEPIRTAKGTKPPFAQVAHEVLGVDFDTIKVLQGDTLHTPYSTATWGSRSMVHGRRRGGARLAHWSQRVRRESAHGCCRPTQRTPRSPRVKVVAGNGSVTLREVARAWYLQPQNLPPDVDTGGLEVTAGYRADARQRHLHLCHPCRRRRGRSADRT